MCLNRKTSGYVNCGCGGHGLSDAPAQSTDQPATQTEKDVKEEAKKYVNTEVPAHNKLFIATLFGVGLLLFNARGN